MPTYEYACTECGERLEVVQRFSDDPLTDCSACGGALRKLFSPVGIVFKGSGFYRTDSRNGKAPAAGNGKAPGESSSAGPAKDGSAASGDGKAASGDGKAASGDGKAASTQSSPANSSSAPAAAKVA